MLRFPFPLKNTLLLLGLAALPVFAWLWWAGSTSPKTIALLTAEYGETGERVKQDLDILPALAFGEDEERYVVEDSPDGIDVRFADTAQETFAEREEGGGQQKKRLSLSFPKDYSRPIEVKLDDTRTIGITDVSGTGKYLAETLEEVHGQDDMPAGLEGTQNLFGDASGQEDEERSLPRKYLRYQSEDGRKDLFYAFQKDQATGEKKLKHWTIYRTGNGLEEEGYRFENAKLRINDRGEAEVYYFGEKELQDEAVRAEVDADLLARAQRTLAKEIGEDILGSRQVPVIIIPAPYYLDKTGEKHAAEWRWNAETGILSVTLSLTPDRYPIALDPTLSFTAPGRSDSGNAIGGEAANNYFGFSLAAGDWNADGKTDLAVGAYGYSTSTGRAYIFHNDGTIPATAATADVIITGEATNDLFGFSLAAGDWNADGKTDLAVGAYGYSSSTGRAYIFHNDGTIPTTAATADVIITGEATSNYFGFSLAAGDWNADGKTDLAVGAYGYSSFTGRTYIFHNDGTIPATAATADIIITGEITGEATGNSFGFSLAAGDWNADGKTDLAVGATGYSTSTGRAYIFHNDGTIPTTAATADIIITGQTTSNSFGGSLAAGDWNADGKTDLAVGATGYSTSTGRAYIFHNDGTIPATAATADIIITSQTTSNSFGYSLAAGDWNADGKTDLAVGATGYSTSTGRAYIFISEATTAIPSDSALIRGTLKLRGTVKVR